MSKRTIAADRIERGTIIAGRPVERVMHIGRRVLIYPHGWGYDYLDSVVIDDGFRVQS